MKYFMKWLVIFIAFLMVSNAIAQQLDPLPSWKNGPIKQSILEFVRTITNKNNKDYVPPEKRIATFDNDGTLWLEQPLYTQALFIMERINSLAAKHPEWRTQMPFKAVLDHDIKAQSHFTLDDYAQVLTAAITNVTTDDYLRLASDWLAKTKNPRYHLHYTQLIYQPMLEVLDYLRKNGFDIYIVTGGGQDFVRAFSEKVYHVPIEKVIGSTTKTKYVYEGDKSILMHTPDILFISDNVGKPEAIHLFIGKKPIIAFGNSDGDQQMLEWTQSNEGKHLMLLVHHDDAVREYAYGPESKVGMFSNALMNEATSRGWKVISMKNDWKVIFPFEKLKKQESSSTTTKEPDATVND